MKLTAYAWILAPLAFGGVALARDYSATLDLNYANAFGGGAAGNFYGINGSAALPLNLWGANVGVDAGYRDVVSGGSHSNWNFGGTLFWPMDWGRVGATAAYHSLDLGGGVKETVWNYHGAAELYAGRAFTLGAKFGGASGGNGFDGWYAGAEAVAYLHPDFAFNASFDYAKDNHFTFFDHEYDYSVGVEWQLDEQLPVSVYGGYSWAQASMGAFFGTPHVNVVFVGLRFYTNSGGVETLVDHHRNGTTGWLSSLTPFTIGF